MNCGATLGQKKSQETIKKLKLKTKLSFEINFIQASQNSIFCDFLATARVSGDFGKKNWRSKLYFRISFDSTKLSLEKKKKQQHFLNSVFQ